MSAYVIRPYGRSLDEDFCVSHWLQSWAQSYFGREWLANLEEDDGGHVFAVNTACRTLWWQQHSPYVAALLRAAETRLLVSPRDPDVIHAFACLEPGVVHYILAKRKYHDHSFTSQEMFRALLADRLDQPQRVTHELVDLHLARLPMPDIWRPDAYFNARRHYAQAE